ncbi:MAG: TetR/AcrR family transcriptional regulator [Solirubrobacterales bacterium]|nr:TetR/AcrR family transcriptional regulator [Solirubrobacterales bacterium]
MAATGTRMTADERREELVEAAIAEFAQGGLAGTSTEAIARRAGISHAYLFRLLGTKRELFLAAVDRAFGRVIEVFTAVEGAPPAFADLGAAYQGMIEDGHELAFQFQAYAACGDPDIRERVERRYTEIFDWVRRATGASVDETRLFMATGLLISVGSLIGSDSLSPDGTWGRRLKAAAG